MKYIHCVFSALVLLCSSVTKAQDKVLIFSKTAAFRHESIPKGAATVAEILKNAQITSVHTEDASYFNADSLQQFGAIIFLSTTGDILNKDQKEAFQTFIRSGKGFVGIHASSDTEHNWPWYGGLVGGYFSSHPAVQEAKIDVIETEHISTSHLSKIWWHKDEWYDYKDVQPGLHILMKLDEESYQGGKMGKFHPIAWFQPYDGGRSFYTGLGHTDESFDVLNFQKHILGGVKYALGKE